MNVIQWIRSTSILRLRYIIVIRGTVTINYNVLEYGATLDRIPDLWLMLFGEANTLCITAAFKIEDTVITPAVLIITDQAAGWVSREGCFTCAGKPEEKGSIVVRANVCRAV